MRTVLCPDDARPGPSRSRGHPKDTQADYSLWSDRLDLSLLTVLAGRTKGYNRTNVYNRTNGYNMTGVSLGWLRLRVIRVNWVEFA